MEALTSTVEEYLEKLFWMNEAGIDATQANLARAVGVSQPTALEMVRRLVDDGFVVRDERKRLQFTEMGEAVGEPHRHAPPPDRGVPRAGLRHPVGRGARGGALVRARRLREPRGAHARAARRRHDLPARASDRRRRARAGRAARDRARRLDRARAAPRERGRGAARTPSSSRASSPATRSRSRGSTGEELELQTPAKGATTLSIPESRAVTVAIESSGDGEVAEVDVPGAAVALHTSWGR